MSEPTPTTCPRCENGQIATGGHCPTCAGTGRVPPAPTAEPTPEQRANMLLRRTNKAAVKKLATIRRVLGAAVEGLEAVAIRVTEEMEAAAAEAEAAARARGRAEGLREAARKCREIGVSFIRGGQPGSYTHVADRCAAAVAALAVPPDDRGGK